MDNCYERPTSSVAAFKRFAHLCLPRTRFISDVAIANGFSPTELALMSELFQESESPVVIAFRLGLDETYVSWLVSRWSKEGFVEILPHPDNGRQRLVALTAAGREVTGDLDAKIEALIDRTLLMLSPDEERRLVQALETLDAIFARLDCALSWLSLSRYPRPPTQRRRPSASPG